LIAIRPFDCGGVAAWPPLHDELGELRSPAIEVEAGQVKQVLEKKDALAARLRRSPDLLNASADAGAAGVRDAGRGFALRGGGRLLLPGIR
jgi:hypothetical protein